jgi:hypothetical protein
MQKHSAEPTSEPTEPMSPFLLLADIILWDFVLVWLLVVVVLGFELRVLVLLGRLSNLSHISSLFLLWLFLR